MQQNRNALAGCMKLVCTAVKSEEDYAITLLSVTAQLMQRRGFLDCQTQLKDKRDTQPTSTNALWTKSMVTVVTLLWRLTVHSQARKKWIIAP
jgi:hypothetical protein